MGAERYILVSEANCWTVLEEAGCWRGWIEDEAGRCERLDAGRDVETDVAIEDDW
jgi:hypothetical protein